MCVLFVLFHLKKAFITSIEDMNANDLKNGIHIKSRACLMEEVVIISHLCRGVTGRVFSYPTHSRAPFTFGMSSSRG